MFQEKVEHFSPKRFICKNLRFRNIRLIDRFGYSTIEGVTASIFFLMLVYTSYTDLFTNLNRQNIFKKD